MSSTTYPGDLGGLAGADAKCQARADAAALGGTFVALLYTLADEPTARIAGSRGWVDLEGRVIGDTPASLVFAPVNPLRVTELGTRVTEAPEAPFAWWGGHPPGSQTCMDWTTTATDTNGTHVVSAHDSFDTDTYTPCAASTRLVCAEVGRAVAVTPPSESGRNAFVSVASWTPSGLAAADALCQAEADDAGLPGSYLAYLTTSTASADARFSVAGLPWRRVTGVRLTQTADELVGAAPAMFWDSFIASHADGTHTSTRAWTGTTTENCADWTTASAAVVGYIGATHSARRGRLRQAPVPCDGLRPLLCLQE